MGQCRTGDFSTNYVLYKSPKKCVGCEAEGTPKCEHFIECATDIGREFGTHAAQNRMKASKSNMQSFLRFKFMCTCKGKVK